MSKSPSCTKKWKSGVTRAATNGVTDLRERNMGENGRKEKKYTRQGGVKERAPRKSR